MYDVYYTAAKRAELTHKVRLLRADEGQLSEKGNVQIYIRFRCRYPVFSNGTIAY